MCYEEFPSGEYDQVAMRGHLRTCIVRGVMTHFPSSMRLDLMCNLIIAMILKSTHLCHDIEEYGCYFTPGCIYITRVGSLISLGVNSRCKIYACDNYTCVLIYSMCLKYIERYW